MDKIVLKTAGLPLPGRKRAPDIDHAIQILDMVRRGYTVNASDGVSMFSYSFMKYPDHSFSNQPEGTNEVMRMFLNYGTDNAALYDTHPPEWCSALERLIDQAKPANLYVTRNMTLTHRAQENEDD